jgi:hypothetical protein
MPAIEVFLPMPPTSNNMYVNRRGKGRVKSDQYNAWIEEAGRKPLAGKWARIARGEDCRLAWTLHLTCHGLPSVADLSNRLKPVEDLICAMTGLRDRYTQRIIMSREPSHTILGDCVRAWITVEDE